ncbi:MAG: S-layer homology domain-containing protein, partial [Acidimicrobiia bacterium]
MDRTFTLHIKARWLRVAALAALVAVVVVPTTAIASHRFADVPDSNTFHADISAIADAGVTFGCNPPANTLYCPDGNVTRGQMAAFLNRLGALSGQTPVVNAKTALSADTLDGFDSTDFLKVGEGGGGDADTLDGLDSLAFWQKTDTVDAGLLDGIDSTGFVAQGEADSVTSAMTA